MTPRALSMRRRKNCDSLSINCDSLSIIVLFSFFSPSLFVVSFNAIMNITLVAIKKRKETIER